MSMNESGLVIVPTFGSVELRSWIEPSSDGMIGMGAVRSIDLQGVAGPWKVEPTGARMIFGEAPARPWWKFWQ